MNDNVSAFEPLVSIIIPVYNGANYLKEAIDSALNQIYPNIEILVVNDGSNDGGKTEEIALSYGDKIRYFKKDNGRVASALNYGIDRMKGTYFSWLSHDDVYLPDKIGHQISILSQLKNKDTILYSGYELINEKSKGIAQIDPGKQLTGEQLDTSLIPLFRGLIHGCSLLIPKKYFEEIGKFNEELRTTQDYRLWFDFLRKSPIKFCNKLLIQSRFHDEQDSKKIPTVDEEANELWINLVDMLTEEEMIDTEGSEYAFLRRTAIFLKKTPYQKAYQYVQNKAEESFADTSVSIIIPFYNRLDVTRLAIESALGQTHKEIEIIVVNDGSTDDTSELEQFCNTNEKIKYYCKENAGPGAARNYGITKSTGNYIAFLDSDDQFLPSKIELQLKHMVDADCYFSHTSYDKIDNNGGLIGTIHSGKSSGEIFPEIIYNCLVATPTTLIKKSLLDNHVFPESFSVGEDVCLWIDLAYRRKVAGLDIPLVKVNVNENSTINQTHGRTLGKMNIVNHLLRNANYSCYKEEITKLLTSVIYDLVPPPDLTSQFLSFWKRVFLRFNSVYKSYGLMKGTGHIVSKFRRSNTSSETKMNTDGTSNVRRSA